MTKKHLLILNSGSSSIKFSVFELNKKEIKQEVLSGIIEKMGANSLLSYTLNNKSYKVNYSSSFNIKNWWKNIHNLLEDFDIKYVGFRMVHGGEEFVTTTKVNQAFLQKIAKYSRLAPLHNPIALDLIHLVRETWPKVAMSVSFDTAWYKTLAPDAYLYSLPLKYYKKYGIRKYGFHGLSHQSATEFAADVLQKNIKNMSVVTCHLGSGSSLTWFEKGKVKDTTMGFSPNEGLTMATRSGDVSAGIIFYLHRELKMSMKQIEDLLDKKSGLYALAGMDDMRDILLAAGHKVSGYKSSLKYTKEQKKLARQALEVFAYDARRYLASYVAMSKRLDAIVFTGTVGINSPVIRKMILKGISKPKNCDVLVAPEGEMKNLANKTKICLIKK